VYQPFEKVEVFPLKGSEFRIRVRAVITAGGRLMLG
jgi:hypothetical protein